MRGSRWLTPADFMIGLIVGVLMALFWGPFLKTEAYAQSAAPKQVQFVKTAILLTPAGKPSFERWQDPETKVFCYATPQGVAFSCAR